MNNFDGSPRRFATDELPVEYGTMNCKAEIYSGSPLLDTEVILEARLFITWSKREELAKKLSDLFNEYAI